MNRHVYRVDLAPVLGSVFQPTGFPDIGAATFTRYTEDGTEQSALLVESVQSMANRLENTAWDQTADTPVSAVAGLPWVRVVRAGTDEHLTSSRQEAHRLASPFVHNATLNGTPMLTVLGDRLGLLPDTPHDRRAMALAVARLDPFCLLHGVFFSQKTWHGQPRFTRAVSAVIEAHDVHRAVSGGRKSDRVRHQLSDEVGGTAEGYGSVPFHRTEWTARRIQASFVIDVQILRSYGLPDPVGDMLETLAQWEIRTLLDTGMRLRTACDLEPAGQIESRQEPLPGMEELTERLGALVPAAVEVLDGAAPLTVAWQSSKPKAKATK